ACAQPGPQAPDTERPRFLLSCRPISFRSPRPPGHPLFPYTTLFRSPHPGSHLAVPETRCPDHRPRLLPFPGADFLDPGAPAADRDRKSTRLNSSHVSISYAVFCLKKKNEGTQVAAVDNLLAHGPSSV